MTMIGLLSRAASSVRWCLSSSLLVFNLDLFYFSVGSSRLWEERKMNAGQATSVTMHSKWRILVQVPLEAE